jgi:4-hydroxy-3-methylbut-2-enyl diphosphate reductase
VKIVLSETLSYCFGVRKTLQLLEKLLAENPQRPYAMLGEVVHNEHVIEALKAKGLRFVERLADAPPGAVIVLQSHGSPRAVYEELERRGLEFIDATCPMVEVIHKRVREVERQGYVPVIIGQTGHEEVRGIAGQVGRAVIVRTPDEVTPELFRDIARAGVVVQSTFVREDALRVLGRIRALVPEVVFYDTICQPTKSRQREVEKKSRPADTVIIIGSKRSANTLHLYRIAQKNTPCTYLLDRAEGVDAIEIPADATVFVASGASTPEELIFEVVRRLESRGKGRTKSGRPGRSLPIRRGISSTRARR